MTCVFEQQLIKSVFVGRTIPMFACMTHPAPPGVRGSCSSYLQVHLLAPRRKKVQWERASSQVKPFSLLSVLETVMDAFMTSALTVE